MSYHRIYPSDLNPPPYYNDGRWGWTRNFPLGELGPADLSTNQAGSCSGLAAGAMCMMWSGRRPSAGTGRWVPGHCPNVPGKTTECWVPAGVPVAPPTPAPSPSSAHPFTPAPPVVEPPIPTEDTGGGASPSTIVLVGGIVAFVAALGFVGYRKLAAKREARDVKALAAKTPHRAVRRNRNRRRTRRHR